MSTSATTVLDVREVPPRERHPRIFDTFAGLASGESMELVVDAPKELAKYLAYKGSIVINGVSLTVNRIVDTEVGCEFAINLIPHTVAVTTLKHLKVGAKVNLEVDLIARYVERMLSMSQSKV